MVFDKSSSIKITYRHPSIDLLRFIAAMMVATFHWGLELGNQRFEVITDLPIIGDLVKYGNFGVEIFFVISGFVIIGAAQKYNSIEFIFARLNRLIPGLLICMLIVLLVGSHFIRTYENPISSFFHSIFLTYQVAGVEPLTTPLWTLLIEMKFYIGIAVFLFLLPRIFKTWSGILLVIAFWEITIILIQEFTSPLGTFLTPYITLNGYSNFFALGICYKLLCQLTFKLTKGNLLVLLISLYEINLVFFEKEVLGIPRMYLMVASIMIVFSAKCILPPLAQRISYWLGLSSYLIYLLHLQLGMTIVLQIQSRLSDNIFVMIGLASALITVISIILAIFIEKPLQRFSERIFRHFYPSVI